VPWNAQDLKTIQNKDYSIERWESFLKIAPTTVLNVLEFATALGTQLNIIRTEEPEFEYEEVITQDNWMQLGEDKTTDPDTDNKYDKLTLIRLLQK